MGELLPTLAASGVRAGLLEYLETTFSLADRPAKLALTEFLEHPEDGIFKGPYLRLRLPFRPADDGWRDVLGWHPLDDGQGFAPYGHQAATFARLSTAHRQAGERPEPTLVTTGTGSGKTEAFLYPILDHVLRAKARGAGGVKALILYPMNALANDQAQRLARLITDCPPLSGVTAGLYTGQQGGTRTKVSADGLITDRHIMRSSPPDILLTNYKMLDQLLLRQADAKIWAQSATSLQYLVLDEFHTYDGAQGTDVAMLLRRLGLTLKAHGATGDRPLAHITPVATSATLGDGGDTAEMRSFAETVFGEPFSADSVITESRMTLDEWIGDADTRTLPDPVDGRELAEAVTEAVDALGADPEPPALADAVVGAMAAATVPMETRPAFVRAHPLTRRLLQAAQQASPIRELAADVLPAADAADAEACLTAFAGLLSHLRAIEGTAMASVEVHLWIRELTRIDREAVITPRFAWGDDGGLLGGEADESELGVETGQVFPALYCRHCGRSGWGIVLSPADAAELDTSDADIRREHLTQNDRFRPLILATREADERSSTSTDDEPVENLRWFYVGKRQILAATPSGEEARDGSVLPVLTHAGIDAPDLARSDTCPACQQRDGIRFLGSAMATQLSVALSTLFGTTSIDSAEKKMLVFTDSVQDAAHRAGFVQARSHSLTVRSVLRHAVDHPRALDTLAERVIEQAGDDATARYRILPPDLADRDTFKDFWQRPRLAAVPVSARGRVSKRVAFDAALEFGLQSHLGRTLELTGTIAAQVQATEAAMRKAAHDALEEAGGQLSVFGDPSDAVLIAWVRGVLERMRERGAIEHPWLTRYIKEDGNRHFVWRGRKRDEGMPAFPTGRMAPAFPRVGPAITQRESGLDPVSGAQSWYAQWTVRALHVTAAEGGALARLLLKRLAAVDVLTVTMTTSGGEVYAIAPSSVLVEPVSDEALESGKRLLACDACQAQVPGTASVTAQLTGAPCLVTRCSGTLAPQAGDVANFYRRLFSSRGVQRVIAREHTSLLDDEVRVAYEEGFKRSAEAPDAPNVLVATPTLEMGIDIGDLSTVMLASLPRSVASYLQRVGRAGRLTGSALNLAFVSGRGDQLPQLGEPKSMINGKVRPPATYLDAGEILRRQYVASLGDVEARSAKQSDPKRAREALGTFEEGDYLHRLATRAETDPDHLEAFLAAFPLLADQARDDLRAWVTPKDGPLTSPMAQRLLDECKRWHQQADLVGHRITAIEDVLPGLKQLADMPVPTDDDKQAYAGAQAALRIAKAQRADLESGYWIGALEYAGLFPNYTLLDDSVTLDVGLSWIDPDTGTYETERQSFQRNAGLALREFAPGATFYARGQQARVNAVDLGNKGEAIRTWAFCAACGFSADVTETSVPASCPRCDDKTITDVSQRLEVVELTRVSSTMRRDEATIDDAREDRVRERFQEVVTADYEPGGVTAAWYVDGYGFGAKHVRNITVKWLNVGRANGLGSTRVFATSEVHAELFRLCQECGQVDRTAGSNSKYDHRPWCSLREASDEESRSVALSRTLETEGLLLRLPPSVTLGSTFALPSLTAAVKLGLREHIGGAPDHLSVEAVVDPSSGGQGANVQALLLHDLVPGGTGYLADLADTLTLQSILLKAYAVVRDCECASTPRLACHKCLLPFAPSWQTRSISRAEAEKQLRDILLGGAPGEVPADGPPAWTTTTEPTTVFDPESMMEQKFRKVLMERLKVLGATVKVVPQITGERWNIHLGGRAWTLDPQVLMSGCKPDFVLRCSDPTVPPMALFCDGQQYHASAKNNRLADDASKRAVLRDLGVFVVALTWGDLEDTSPVPPPWYDEGSASHVLGHPDFQLKPSHLELLRGGPLDLIVTWIQSPDPDGLRNLGRALPLFLVTQAMTRCEVSGGQPLSVSALALLDGAGLGGASATAWAWRDGPLIALSRLLSPTETAIAVVLDDAPDVVADGITDPWRSWLRLSNIIGLRPSHTEITVRTLVGSDQLSSPDGETEAPTATDELSSGWKAVIGEATSEEAGFLTALAQDGVPVPEYGPEIDGIPLGPTWTASKVTVDVDLDGSERESLTGLGWTVVPMDVDAVRDALNAGGN